MNDALRELEELRRANDREWTDRQSSRVYLSVPLEPPDQQHWQAAAGYVELGMFLEADTELDKIDPFNRAAPEVLAIRLAIYHGLKK